MLMETKDFVLQCRLLMAIVLLGGAEIACAAGVRQANEDMGVESDPQELPTSHIHQTLDGTRISGEDRLRLRQDLAEYSRSADAAHAQIEQQRKVMRQRILERFQTADRDGNGVISREEAMEMMPQVSRHFTQFDLNSDGVISMDELETIQMRIAERQHKGVEQKEKDVREKLLEVAPVHVKDTNVLATKRAL